MYYDGISLFQFDVPIIRDPYCHPLQGQMTTNGSRQNLQCKTTPLERSAIANSEWKRKTCLKYKTSCLQDKYVYYLGQWVWE
jgi:hypothetical protein